MTVEQLRQRLEAEGFRPAAYHIGETYSLKADAYCLVLHGTTFETIYAERGQKTEEFGYYVDEATACQAFYDLLVSHGVRSPSSSRGAS